MGDGAPVDSENLGGGMRGGVRPGRGGPTSGAASSASAMVLTPAATRCSVSAGSRGLPMSGTAAVSTATCCTAISTAWLGPACPGPGGRGGPTTGDAAWLGRRGPTMGAASPPPAFC